MPLPRFDAHGNLTVGQLFRRGGAELSLVPASLHELHDRFVRDGLPRRAYVWDGWMRHRHVLDQMPVPYITLVNGSFTTTKPEPGDIDVCVLYEAEILNAMPPAQQRQFATAMEHDRAKRDFAIDLYGVAVYNFIHPRFSETTLRNLTYWTRVFGIDRLGRHKSVVAVCGGGTL